LTATDPAIAQSHKNQGRFNKDFLDYIPEELMEKPDNSFNCPSRFVAATEASMRFSAVLPMGGSTSISKMYFSHWEPSGVSERMWSVNYDASMSGEYQTPGGYLAGSGSNWNFR
jgi:hypothetical protein